MSMKDWEKKVLAEAGAAERVNEIEDELRLAGKLMATASPLDLRVAALNAAVFASRPAGAPTSYIDPRPVSSILKYADEFYAWLIQSSETT